MALAQSNFIDDEQGFIDEVMNKKPQFKSNKDAFAFFRAKLEMIAQQLNLTPEELVIKADSNGRPSQLEMLALSLNLKICALEKLI